MRADPKRPLLQIHIQPENNQLKGRERELIDRARVFQTAISQLTPFYGAVDLSINGMDFTAGGPKGTSLKQLGVNYCERHGRCNVGCLPGAGQTLNRQLIRAIYGLTDTGALDRRPVPDGQCLLKHVALQLTPLADADHISAREDGSDLIQYRQRGIDDPTASPQTVVVSSDRVIVAAGSLGTSELMLRSRALSVETNAAEGLGELGAKLGYGFSPNGDHIAFLAETKERVNLTYRPVTTSFGQFRPDAPQATGFHNVEDQGAPRSLASLTGHGVPIFQRLAQDDGIERYVDALGAALQAMHEIFTRAPDRTYAAAGAANLSADRPESEDELTARVMCVVAQGKDDANGQFSLEGDRLRLRRTDDKTFHEDKIYADIKVG